MINKRSMVAVLCVCAGAFALASAARYRLIEPADITAHCDSGGQEAWCMLRFWIIQAFVHQRIGWAALGLALVAVLTSWRIVAGAALFTACAGLILYITELSAPAALLALLVFVREGQAAAPASNNSNAPYDSA